MGFAQVGGHCVGVLKVGNRRREMRLAGEQDVFGVAGRIVVVFMT